MNYTNSIEASYSQGQYLVFYIIISLIFFSLTCLCIEEVTRYFDDSFWNFFSNFRENIKQYILWPCFSFLVVFFSCLLLFLGLIYGPIIFAFNLTFKENFQKGCKIYFFAHIYTNIGFPLIFYILKTTSEYLISKKLLEKENEIKKKILTKTKENKIAKIYFKLFIPFSIIFFIIICCGFSLYFSKGFIDICEEDDKEVQNYILTSLFTYFTLNLVVMSKDIIIVYSTDDVIDTCCTLFCFYLFIFSLFAIILQQLILKEHISREVFYTVLMFSNLSFIPIFILFLCCILIMKYLIFKENDLHEFQESIGKNKISFLGDYWLERYIVMKDTLLWKINEKSKILIEKERFYDNILRLKLSQRNAF